MRPVDWLRTFGAHRATANALHAIERRHQQDAVVESLAARLDRLAAAAPATEAAVA